MRRPQLIRDAVGLHLVWGQWMVSRAPTARRFEHLVRHAAMGATRIDMWLWRGFRLDRVRSTKSQF